MNATATELTDPVFWRVVSCPNCGTFHSRVYLPALLEPAGEGMTCRSKLQGSAAARPCSASWVLVLSKEEKRLIRRYLALRTQREELIQIKKALAEHADPEHPTAEAKRFVRDADIAIGKINHILAGGAAGTVHKVTP